MESVIGCFSVNNPLHFAMGTFVQEVGRKIKIARRSRDPEISQESLSDLTDLSRQTINKVEKGELPKVSLLVVARIAKALNITVDELVGKADPFSQSVTEMPAHKKKGAHRHAAVVAMQRPLRGDIDVLKKETAGKRKKTA